MSKKPHLAGTEEDHEMARHIQQTWLSQGLDWAKLAPYRVLLSYPDTTDPTDANRVQVVSRNTNQVQYTTQTKEPSLSSSQSSKEVIPPFNAYSASGALSGELVYVNYGRIEDFDYLTRNLGLSLRGKIMIARYGEIFCGYKVVNAQSAGAAGMILYSDPANYAVDGWDKVYPNSWWLPPSGVQRGTVRTTHGDPLTPGYPATDDAYRIREEDAELPTIPVHPISYKDAYELLSRMRVDSGTPSEWKGSMNISYTIRDPTANW